MDIYGDHCLVCSNGGERTKRHNLLRNHVYHFCAGAGLAPELEKPGLLMPRPYMGALPEDGKAVEDPSARRPADVFLPRWRHGTPVALDFAVTSGLRSDSVVASAQDAASPLRAYEDFKRTHLDTHRTCAAEGITFIPVIAEADGGGWGTEAQKVFYNLAKAKTSLTGETKNTHLSQLYQSLGFILHRENARSILRRCVVSTPTALNLLAAAATLESSAADAAALP